MLLGPEVVGSGQQHPGKPARADMAAVGVRAALVDVLVQKVQAAREAEGFDLFEEMLHGNAGVGSSPVMVDLLRCRATLPGMQAVDWDEVRERTIALYARWGTDASGQAGLPPALSEAQLRQVEEQFGVTFPDDYRQYLLRVSAGGRVRTLRLDGERWGWDGARHADHAELHLPFPDHDTALAASEDLWEKEPKREDYASTAAYRAEHDAWREAADAAEDARACGAAFLHDDGCGFYTLLVMSGPMRGTMWFDGRATCDRLNPLLNDARQPASFAEWYLDWLAHEEPLTTPELRRAAHQSWKTGTDTPIWLRWFDS